MRGHHGFLGFGRYVGGLLALVLGLTGLAHAQIANPCGAGGTLNPSTGACTYSGGAGGSGSGRETVPSIPGTPIPMVFAAWWPNGNSAFAASDPAAAAQLYYTSVAAAWQTDYCEERPDLVAPPTQYCYTKLINGNKISVPVEPHNQVCPAGTTANNAGTCDTRTCPTPSSGASYTLDTPNTTCSRPAQCRAGQASSSTFMVGVGRTAAEIAGQFANCTGSCATQPGTITCTPFSTQGALFCTQVSTQTGASCTSNPDPTAPTANPPSQGNCPSNQRQGTVNGAPYCYTPADSTTITPGTTTTTGPNGSNPSTTNGTTTTTCVNGVCTSTTTTTGADGTTTTTVGGSGFCATNPLSSICQLGGGTGSTSTGGQGGGGFCAENPTSKICLDNGASGGLDCTTPPTITGDAALGAIAYQTWETRCALGHQTALTDLGEAVVGGNDPMKGSLPDPNSAANDVNLPTTLDTSNPIGAACPSDQVVSVGTRGSFTIPWSRLCDPLTWLGRALVAVAMLTALGIVRGGVQGG